MGKEGDGTDGKLEAGEVHLHAWDVKATRTKSVSLLMMDLQIISVEVGIDLELLHTFPAEFFTSSSSNS